MNSFINRDEIRRLEKAARDKDKKKLFEWAVKFEMILSEAYRKEYEETYQQEIQQSVNAFITALVYTLHYTEEYNFSLDTIKEILSDLFATIDLYRTGESNPKEYLKQLQQEGIIIDDYDYNSIYKTRMKRLSELETIYKKLIDDAKNTQSHSNEV